MLPHLAPLALLLVQCAALATAFSVAPSRQWLGRCSEQRLQRPRSLAALSSSDDTATPEAEAAALEASEGGATPQPAAAVPDTEAPAIVSRSKPATLDRSTPWRLFLSVRDPEGPENGATTDIAVVVRFVEEPGFEPPQGRVEVLEENRYVRADQGPFARWTLSEDPDDRKDSLWIWGLFRQLPFPFLLFQLEIDEIPLGGTGADGVARVIPAGKLYAKVPHKFEKETGSQLRAGDVGVKYTNIVSADLAGLATADIGEVKPCGTVRFTPLEFAPGVKF
ncbi:hypothetical protein JKP88DRAFT_199167 [Tribonema minus]|uniref:Uncharacterized protein n=1 Tax=Tribonema minus TaxID=303371 RepID=A0A836CDS7_9STRA|nr:hypothetical protein JKP88DRAFT_199167 [Tribonema minus]